MTKINSRRKTEKPCFLPSLRGMTPFEIDRMLDMAMSDNGSLSSEDKEMNQRQKKQMSYEMVLMKRNDPEIFLIVYLIIKALVVVVAG